MRKLLKQCRSSALPLSTLSTLSYHTLPWLRPSLGCAQVARVCEAAVQCWWEESHPGWMIFTLGNQHFESLDQIIQARP